MSETRFLLLNFNSEFCFKSCQEGKSVAEAKILTTTDYKTSRGKSTCDTVVGLRKDTIFCQQGIEKLIPRQGKCPNFGGDYVET